MANISRLAKEFHWETSTTLVFVLRAGARWSNGVPVTTSDVRFWWEDYSLNDELRPSGLPDGDFVTPGGVAHLRIVDEFTFKITFKDPNPLYLETSTKRSEYQPAFPLMPGHYLRQYH